MPARALGPGRGRDRRRRFAGERLAARPGASARRSSVPAAVGTAPCGWRLLYAVTTDWRLPVALAAGASWLSALDWPRRLGARVRDGAARAAAREAAVGHAGGPPAAPAGVAGARHGAASSASASREDRIGARNRSKPPRAGAGSLSRTAVLRGDAALPARHPRLGAWLAAGAAISRRARSSPRRRGDGLAVVGLIRDFTRWRRLDQEAVRPLFARSPARSAACKPRERTRRRAARFPRAGALVAKGVSAYDPASGARISGVDCTHRLPGPCGPRRRRRGGPAGLRRARSAASSIPRRGRLTFGGVDLAAADPGERARRIAFAGGETILIPGSLRDNLLYGCPAPTSPDLEQRLVGGGRGRRPRPADPCPRPRRHARPGAASRSSPRPSSRPGAPCARRSRPEASIDLVEPFDAARYNHHATIGENILFGEADRRHVPRGEPRLAPLRARHPRGRGA